MKSKALPAALFVNALLATAAFNYVSDIAENALVGLCTEALVAGGALFGVWLATRTPLNR